MANQPSTRPQGPLPWSVRKKKGEDLKAVTMMLADQHAVVRADPMRAHSQMAKWSRRKQVGCVQSFAGRCPSFAMAKATMAGTPRGTCVSNGLPYTTTNSSRSRSYNRNYFYY